MPKTKVLLVEPDAAARRAFASGVKDSEFELAAEVRDVETGLLMCKELTPAVVVLPLSDRGSGDAGEVIKAFQDLARNAKIITTYDSADRHLVVAAVRAGACASVKKPFDQERVLACLEGALQTRGGLAEASKKSAQVAGSRWPARIRTGGMFGRWQDALVAGVTPGGLTITCEDRLVKGSEQTVEISVPGSEKPVKATLNMRQVMQLPSGLYRAAATFGKLDPEARKVIGRAIPRETRINVIPQTGGVRVPEGAAEAEGTSLQSVVSPVEGRERAFMVTLCGLLDSNAIEVVESMLSEISQTQTTILFDLAEVRYISSSGVGVLLSVMGRWTRRGGRVILFSLRREASVALNLVGVAGLFTICADRQEALAALGPARG